MLDTIPTPDTKAPAWAEQLTHGDVIAYRFPLAELDPASEAVDRPCLVLDVTTIAGVRFALLAYGTATRHGNERGYEIRVRNADRRAAGLRLATRFLGDRRSLVPLTDAAFQVSAETGSPVLGRLGGVSAERMHRVRARIHAERDMTAERRRMRMPRNSIRDRDFQVQYRQSHRASGPPTRGSARPSLASLKQQTPAAPPRAAGARRGRGAGNPRQDFGRAPD